MKSIGLGIAAMLVISIVAWIVMGVVETDSSENFVSPNNSVRLD